MQLSLCIDQGSDGWCPAMWLLYACSLRLVLFFDSNHRAWDDLKGAFAAAGCWDVVLLWAGFHINYGPFDGGAWWRQAQEAAREYTLTVGASCPLLQSLLARIAAENWPGAAPPPGRFRRVCPTGPVV